MSLGDPDRAARRIRVKDRLKKLIAGLFQCDLDELHDETGPGDVRGWD